MVIKLRNKGRLRAYAILLYLAHSPLSFGQQVVMGWEGTSSRGYAVVSPMIVLLHGDRFDWVLRGAASYLYYDVPEPGGHTDVRSPGQALGVALRYSGSRVTAMVGPGYETRQTTRRLATGGQTKMSERGPTLEGNVFFQATPLINLGAVVSYGEANDYLWARGSIKRQISNFEQQSPTRLYLGAEITRAGNVDVKAREVGGLFEIAFPGRGASLQFRSGYSRLKNRDGSRHSEPYFGIAFYRAF